MIARSREKSLGGGTPVHPVHPVILSDSLSSVVRWITRMRGILPGSIQFRGWSARPAFSRVLFQEAPP